AFAGTLVGFLLLLPVYVIGGMGAGDVKMQMGFGSWVGAVYGLWVGLMVIWWAFAIAVLVGGGLAVGLILLRGKLRQHLQHTRGIVGDLFGAGVGGAAQKAGNRKPRMHLLPYGIPLCIGFVGYLFYLNSFRDGSVGQVANLSGLHQTGWQPVPRAPQG